MRKWLVVLLLAAGPAWAQVTVERPWSRATPPGAKVGAGFMTLKNAGNADRVVGASSPVAGRVEMHVTVREGDVMRMREVKGFDVPASGSFELKPGGAHLMLVDLKRALKKGEKVPLTLKLAKGGELKVELLVEEVGARAPAQMKH
ncbi:MAG TPA: copper chaperone PCu(A)C [Burkholderiales bacterium]|nr:copper chaperone PCu(A)C [Burkholderiales bacterium]